jgi:hypothetical protein
MIRTLPGDVEISQEPTETLRALATLKINTKRTNEVEEYLTKHADLGSALEEICAAVRAEFGPEAELSLEIYSDPEVQDRYLALCVRQQKYTSDIMDRIEAVAEPFMATLDNLSGQLLITTDFHRPRG